MSAGFDVLQVLPRVGVLGLSVEAQGRSTQSSRCMGGRCCWSTQVWVCMGVRASICACVDASQCVVSE